MDLALEALSVAELLRLYADIVEDLRRRGITRSDNNPVADYTEHLVAGALGLEPASNSTAGYDATDSAGLRYQIKGRRLTKHNRSTQLSAIRNLENRPFDYLVAVVYRADFTVDYAAQIPYDVVVTRSRPDLHTNSARFMMTRNVLDDPGVIDLSLQLTLDDTT